MNEATAHALNWPRGYGEYSLFRAYKDPSAPEHSAWFLVMPGGGMAPFNHCAYDPMDEARVRWIAKACNAALASPQPTAEPRAITGEEALTTAVENAYLTAMAAVDHVGAANYASREQEARKWTREAFDKLRSALAASTLQAVQREGEKL